MYHPYKSDKPDKKYYIITNSGRKFILARLARLILQSIRTKQENQDISIGTRKMKCGLNQVLIRLASGPAGCFGINQPLKKVMMTLSNASFKITC